MMNPPRVVIHLTFSANLDMVPGWGHRPDDWVRLVRSLLERNDHYHPLVSVKDVRVEQHHDAHVRDRMFARLRESEAP